MPTVEVPAISKREQLERRTAHKRQMEIEAIERRKVAIELRRGGATYRAIAEALHVSIRTAYNDVQHCLAEVAKLRSERAEEVVEMELERLDRGIEMLQSAAEMGDVTAIEAIRRHGESRRKLLGLDAPTKIAPTDSAGNDLTSMSDAQLSQRLAELLVAMEEKEDAIEIELVPPKRLKD